MVVHAPRLLARRPSELENMQPHNLTAVLITQQPQGTVQWFTRGCALGSVPLCFAVHCMTRLLYLHELIAHQVLSGRESC